MSTRKVTRKAPLPKDAIQWSCQIPVVFEVAKSSLAADSTGVKFTSGDIVLTTDEIACLKGAYIEATWTASATDSVTKIELYDATASSVLTSVSGNTGTNSRSTTGVSLTAGNKLNVRVNVTNASATTGATTALTKAVIILQYGAA